MKSYKLSAKRNGANRGMSGTTAPPTHSASLALLASQRCRDEKSKRKETGCFVFSCTVTSAIKLDSMAPSLQQLTEPQGFNTHHYSQWRCEAEMKSNKNAFEAIRSTNTISIISMAVSSRTDGSVPSHTTTCSPENALNSTLKSGRRTYVPAPSP